MRQRENLVAGEARPKVFSTRHDGLVFVDNVPAHADRLLLFAA